MRKAGLVLKKIAIVIGIAAMLLITIFLIGRYGWKLFGFSVCESAGIESVEVTDGQVRITGFYPGSFTEGFLGYHAEKEDGTLYVGFRFSGFFGIFETGDFHITIPVKGEITEVIIKTKNHEYPVWPEIGTEPELSSANEAEEPAVPVPYEPILSQYRTALTEGWSGQQLLDAGLNFMIRDVPFESVGYSVDDLDDDGIPELVIGTMFGDEFYGNLVFVLYTLDENGDALQIFSSIERDRYYYAGGTRFANIGSSAFDDSFATTLKLEGTGMVDMACVTDPADYAQMELTALHSE